MKERAGYESDGSDESVTSRSRLGDEGIPLYEKSVADMNVRDGHEGGEGV